MNCEIMKCGHCKSLEEDDQCGLPEHRYCAYCQTIEIANDSAECVDKLMEEVALLKRALLIVERTCPCGARPESLQTHSHVIGCPVGEVLYPIKDQCVGCENGWSFYPNGVTHIVPEVKNGGLHCKKKKA